MTRAMNCPACGTETVRDSQFCHQCGAALEATGPDQAAKVTDTPNPPHLASRLAGDSVGAEQERELWRGSFSAKGMINSWLLASLITVTLLVIAVVWRITPEQWLIAGGLAGLMWLGLLLTLLVRKLNVSYELTDQRLIHKVGILRRTTDRIEVIDMDDISYDQSIFERLLGVGSIRVTSSDQTHPKFVLRGIDDVQHVASTMDEARRQERVKRGLHIEAV